MKKRNTMRKLLRYLKKYWLLLALSLLFAALTVAMTLYLPILIGQAVDLIVAPGKVEFSAIASLLLKMGILIGATALSAVDHERLQQPHHLPHRARYPQRCLCAAGDPSPALHRCATATARSSAA